MKFLGWCVGVTTCHNSISFFSESHSLSSLIKQFLKMLYVWSIIFIFRFSSSFIFETDIGKIKKYLTVNRLCTIHLLISKIPTLFSLCQQKNEMQRYISSIFMTIYSRKKKQYNKLFTISFLLKGPMNHENANQCTNKWKNNICTLSYRD